MQIENYESFEELEIRQTMGAQERAAHAAHAEKIKVLTTIDVCLEELDSFFSKRKDLNDRHTKSLFALAKRQF